MSAAFFRIHSELVREAPGSQADTLRALSLTGLSGPVRVLDAGCGPGAASEVLLEALPEATVVGVDLHEPFIAAAQARCARFGGRFRGVAADMAAPPVAGRFDLIWSEGAAYSIGVGAALHAWREILLPGGVLALSEAVWTGPPSTETRVFWDAEYPAMTDMAGVRAVFSAAGYRMRGDFLLSRAAWVEYFAPLAERCDALEGELGADETALVSTRAEIDLWRRFGGDFGYGFFVAEPA